MSYRPWGVLDWVFSRLDHRPWSFLGCIGTEDRSNTAWETLTRLGMLDCAEMWRITDRPSRYSQRATQLCARNQARYEGGGGRPESVFPFDVLAQLNEIEGQLDSFGGKASDSIILDVTSLPKRFFFPALKHLLHHRGTETRNLIVTYTVPEKYASAKLAENCCEWAHIPSFSGSYSREAPEFLIVNVGFDPMGLQDQIDHGEPEQEIKLIFPFPADPRAVNRAYEFVRRIVKFHRPDSFEVNLVDAIDVSDAFDRLRALSSNGSRRCELAPFGPKPISIAMCLYAALTSSEVFYTQPKVYHPEYSSGVALRDGIPMTYAYCIRIGGSDLYQVA